jgi:hypothetical protein
MISGLGKHRPSDLCSVYSGQRGKRRACPTVVVAAVADRGGRAEVRLSNVHGAAESGGTRTRYP